MVSPGYDEWKNLIPELLLGLMGCGGGAFVYTTVEGAENTMKERSGLVLSDVIDWVSDAEREQFNRLVKLGWYYDRLSEYARMACQVDRTKGSLPYHAAVGQGVLEVLEVYRQAVLKIEGCLLESAGEENLWSLLPLEHALAEFFQLFPFLYKSIEYISVEEEKERCGSRDIIHVFENAGQSGLPIVDGCASRIAWHCYQVLFKQMYVWMVRGRLVDPTGDFFIRMEEEEGQPERGVYGMLSEGRSSKYIAAYVVESRLPSSISVSLAKDVLYVGQCARILASLSHRSSPHAAQQGETESSFATSLKSVSISRQGSVDWIHFKRLVHAQKVHLSSQVWKEMHSADRNLQGHIDDLVDVLLQGRGSLYASLLLHMAPFVSSNPDPARASEIASCVFKEAAYSDDASIIETAKSWTGDAFTMTWYDVTNPETVLPVWHPHYDENIFIPSYDAWDGLCMRYDVKWPMHLIFPAPIMRVYGALWQLMFRLGRCLDRLKHIRPMIYTIKTPDNTLKGFSAQHRRMRILYHQLYQLLSTYAHHLHAEIVVRSNEELRDILGSSSSLIDAESKHMKFVTEMVETSCVDIRQVMGVFENMFSCVTSLSSLVENDGIVTENGHAQSLDEVYEYFWSKYNVLYQLLQSGRLQSGQRGEAIRRLLMKLNYNGFLDTNAARQLITHQLHIS